MSNDAAPNEERPNDNAPSENTPSENSSGDASPPRWELVSDDPVGFFGLPTGFDRKDLKRAYNALLRRYKPDKYPQEFQKLRAAFEQLDGELRYGQSHLPPVSRLDDFAMESSE